MRTLKQIIAASNAAPETCSDVERAISMAYEAGRSQMRGCITEGIRRQLATLPASRYHIVQRNAVMHCIGVNGINHNAIVGYGDSGTREAEEILDFDYDL